MGGGQNPKVASIEERNSRNHSEDQTTTRLEPNNLINWKDMLATTRNENPYTKQQKQPEWDGSEVPQIVNNVNGKVTVLGTDGKASSYRNERSYKLVNTTNQIAEKLSSTGKALEKRVFSGFRMPALHKQRSDNISGSSGTGADTRSSTNVKSHRDILKMPSFSKQVTIGNKKFRV